MKKDPKNCIFCTGRSGLGGYDLDCPSCKAKAKQCGDKAALEGFMKHGFANQHTGKGN